MNVEFASNELRRCSEEESAAARAWGVVVGRKYRQRLSLMVAVEDLRRLSQFGNLRVHPLHGAREGQWALVIHDRWRLVFSLLDRDRVRIEEVSNHYDD